MDTTTAISAAPAVDALNRQADRPITAADYHTLGRRQAEFWASQAEAARKSGTDKVSLGFKDLVDLVNPLQHIPIVRNIYQAATGDDTMKPAIKFMGDTLFGGPLAAVSSGVDAVVKQASGKDMMETVVAWFSGDDSAKDTAVAANSAAGAATIAVNPAANAANSNNQVAANTAAQPAATVLAQPAVAIPKFGLASTGPSPAAIAATGAPQQVTATPQSAFFAGLQRNNAKGTQMPIPPGQSQYLAKSYGTATGNSASQQMASMTSAALKLPTKGAGIADSTLPTAGSIIPASAVAGVNLTSSGVIDTPSNPQSDFAQKMMVALDRYQAAKKSGDGDAPAASSGM